MTDRSSPATVNPAKAFAGPIVVTAAPWAPVRISIHRGHYFTVIPYRIVTEATWDLAKDYSWRLRDCGHNVPTSDILIAAVAMEAGIRVYAVDQHFIPMEDVLGLRLYRPGYGGLFAAE